MIVYLIRNLVNAKWYVGKASSLEERMKQHFREARAKRGYTLHAAIRKYGEHAFSTTVLADVPSHDLAYALEAFCIALFKRIDGNPSYNQSAGGFGASGRTVSPTTRLRLSRARRGKTFSASHLANLSAAHKGKSNGPWTLERRAKTLASMHTPRFREAHRLSAVVRKDPASGKFRSAQ